MRTSIPDMPDDRAISLLAVDQYFRELRWTERLSEADEQKYLQRVVRGNAEPANQWVAKLAQDARDILVASYQPLVVSMARKHLACFKHFQLMDLIQEGNVGLLTAFRGYVPSSESSFFTHAAICIHRFLWNALYSGERQLCIKDMRVKCHLSKLRTFQMSFYRLHGELPCVSDVAEALDCALEYAEQLLQFCAYDRFLSLEQMQTNADGEEWEGDLTSLFACEQESEHVLDDGVVSLLHRALERGLSEPQRKWVTLRYGFDASEPDYHTQVELASKLGVGPSTVRDLERYALNNLRSSIQKCVDGSNVSYKLRGLASDDHYTVREVMDCLKRKEATIWRYIKTGVLPAVKVKTINKGANFQYLIPKQAVEAFMSGEAIA